MATARSQYEPTDTGSRNWSNQDGELRRLVFLALVAPATGEVPITRELSMVCSRFRVRR